MYINHKQLFIGMGNREILILGIKLEDGKELNKTIL